jgi:hypothetical protein
MSSHAYAETYSATMCAGFPTPPESTLGAPNLFILNDLLQYICKCTQKHKSTISKKMNLLYMASDPSLYTHYSTSKAKVYPLDMYPFPDNVHEVLNFTACTNNNECAPAKIFHANLLKMRNGIINMNAVLINTLLSLISISFKLLYNQERMMIPNAVFQQCFGWFVIKYRCNLAEDCNTNRMAMAADWHPSMGFEIFTLHLFHGVTFAILSGHPITDKDTADIGISVLDCTELLPEEYKTWILCGNNTRKMNDFFSFKSFWESVVQIAVFTTIPASQHGEGMVATNSEALALLLTDAVSTFGMAYAATQEFLQLNAANIAAI